MRLRRILVTFIFIFSFMLINSNEAMANGTSVVINESNFPDDTLREYVEKYDLNGNGVLTSGELGNVTTMNISSMGITSLKGLEYFENLNDLDCWSNDITYISKDQIKNVMYLDCRDNNINALNFSGLTRLTSFECSGCNLVSLNLEGCTNLSWLGCNNNKLVYLNLRGVAQRSSLSLDLNDNYMLSFEADDSFSASNLGGYGYQTPALLLEKINGEYVADFNVYPDFNLKKLTVFNSAYLDDAQIDYANNTITWDNVADIPSQIYCEYEVSSSYDLESYLTFLIPVEKIELAKKSATITVNDIVSIDATALSAYASNKELSYSSANNKIATVDQYGNVTGKAVGKTKITVMACDGSNVKATFTVTVKLNKTKANSKLVNGKSIKVTWNKVAGAYKYEVYRSTSKYSGYKKVKTTSGTSFTDKTVKRDKKYYYKVKVIAKNSSYNSKYSNIVAKKTVGKLKTPSITVKKATSKSSKVTWKKVTAATKYEVYRSTKKGSGYKKIKTVSGTSYTDKKLKSGVRYYYKVKAIDTTKKYNSKYSSVKSVKM